MKKETTMKQQTSKKRYSNIAKDTKHLTLTDLLRIASSRLADLVWDRDLKPIKHPLSQQIHQTCQSIDALIYQLQNVEEIISWAASKSREKEEEHAEL